MFYVKLAKINFETQIKIDKLNRVNLIYFSLI